MRAKAEGMTDLGKAQPENKIPPGDRIREEMWCNTNARLTLDDPRVSAYHTKKRTTRKKWRYYLLYESLDGQRRNTSPCERVQRSVLRRGRAAVRLCRSLLDRWIDQRTTAAPRVQSKPARASLKARAPAQTTHHGHTHQPTRTTAGHASKQSKREAKRNKSRQPTDESLRHLMWYSASQVSHSSILLFFRSGWWSQKTRETKHLIASSVDRCTDRWSHWKEREIGTVSSVGQQQQPPFQAPRPGRLQLLPCIPSRKAGCHVCASKE